MNYKDLGFTTNKQTKAVFFGQDNQINVLQYLPIDEKIDLIEIALQKSEEDGIYNEMKLDMYFHLNLIYCYSDIVFDAEDRADESKLYDELLTNDVVDRIVEAIPDSEYDFLMDYLTTMKEANMAYKNSAAAVLQSVVRDLPKNAAAAAQIVNSFDPDKYSEVVAFAEQANANRPISVVKD